MPGHPVRAMVILTNPKVSSMFNWRPLLCLMPLFSSAVFAAPPALPLAGDYGEPRVIVSAPEDAAIAHLSWPKVIRTKDGTLVTAYVAGRFHGTHGGGCPAVSVSTDGGKTFTAPQVLKHYGPGKDYTSGGNVAMGLAADGAVVLLSMAFTGDEANTIDGWRSTDNCKTWEEVDVSRLANGKTGSVYGNVFPVPGRGLAVIGHYRKGSTTRPAGLWVSYSADDGKRWSDPKTITDTALVEPAFTFVDGRFIGLARPANTPAWYTQLVSVDGEKWDVATKGLMAAKPTGVEYPSPHISTDPNDPARVLALVSQRFTPAAKNGQYGQIDLYSADVKKLTWEKVSTVVKFPRELGERSDLTYGWMTPLDGDEWFVVFYLGKKRGASDIYGMTIKIPARQ